jgi:hypothetical protein
MSENLMQASEQWWKRPDDQRFLTLEDLKASVAARRDQSWTGAMASNSLRVNATESGTAGSGPGGLLVQAYDPTAGENRQLALSNWSFGQLSQLASAPAGYLRKLPAVLAAINLQYGLERLAQRDDVLLLAQSNGSDVARAFTSVTYGRIWDKQVVEAVEKVNGDGRWTIPAASYAVKNPKRATTLYASDRDVFIFLVDDKNPIEVPQNGGRVKEMRRGFFTWNSEVGAATFGLTTFLYDYVCDNRIIWGATNVRELRIRHTNGAPDRFAYEGDQYLQKYAEEATAPLVAGIQNAQQFDIESKLLNKGKGDTVESWLQSRGFAKAVAKASVETAIAEEGSARSLWDVIQGVTAYARSIPNTDERVALESKAGELMSFAV